jgi:uroporphyrinogen-III synthase
MGLTGAGRPGNELAGHRIAVTRPAEGGDVLAGLLERHGAETVSIPLIRVGPPEDAAPLVRAGERLPRYDWIVFSSAAAVHALAAVLPVAAVAVRARIAAVGAATATAIREVLGWRVDVVPDSYAGSAVVEAMTAVAPVRGAAVLWPRARETGPDLPRDLRAAGAQLDDPEAYRTELLLEAAASLRAMAEAGSISAITLTSPSAVRALAATGPPLGEEILIAVIGPATARAVRQHGMIVHVQPETHTAAGLADAIVRHVADTTEERNER